MQAPPVTDGAEAIAEPRENLSQLARSTDWTRAAQVTPAVEAAIDDAFEYHPWTAAEAVKGAAIRRALASALKVIVANVPPSPDRSAAIRKIREARMDCNSAITHGGKY